MFDQRVERQGGSREISPFHVRDCGLMGGLGGTPGAEFSGRKTVLLERGVLGQKKKSENKWETQAKYAPPFFKKNRGGKKNRKELGCSV